MSQVIYKISLLTTFFIIFVCYIVLSTFVWKGFDLESISVQTSMFIGSDTNYTGIPKNLIVIGGLSFLYVITYLIISKLFFVITETAGEYSTIHIFIMKYVWSTAIIIALLSWTIGMLWQGFLII